LVRLRDALSQHGGVPVGSYTLWLAWRDRDIHLVREVADLDA
jgi:hypothetical protein